MGRDSCGGHTRRRRAHNGVIALAAVKIAARVRASARILRADFHRTGGVGVHSERDRIATQGRDRPLLRSRFFRTHADLVGLGRKNRLALRVDVVLDRYLLRRSLTCFGAVQLKIVRVNIGINHLKRAAVPAFASLRLYGVSAASVGCVDLEEDGVRGVIKSCACGTVGKRFLVACANRVGLR